MKEALVKLLTAKPAGAAVLLVCLTLGATAAGFELGRWWLPALQATVAYPFFYCGLRSGLRGRVVGWMCVWAVVVAVGVVALSARDPERAETVILRGETYRAEMETWLRTGVGKEGDPARFLPEHFLHVGALVAVSVPTGGFGGLLLGAVLLNYMSYYVGSLTAEAVHPLLVVVVAWPPWAWLRVCGFVLLAVDLVPRWSGRLGIVPFRVPPDRRLLIGALGCLVADVVWKAWAAGIWRLWIVRAWLGLPAG